MLLIDLADSGPGHARAPRRSAGGVEPWVLALLTCRSVSLSAVEVAARDAADCNGQLLILYPAVLPVMAPVTGLCAAFVGTPPGMPRSTLREARRIGESRAVPTHLEIVTGEFLHHVVRRADGLPLIGVVVAGRIDDGPLGWLGAALSGSLAHPLRRLRRTWGLTVVDKRSRVWRNV